MKPVFASNPQERLTMNSDQYFKKSVSKYISDSIRDLALADKDPDSDAVVRACNTDIEVEESMKKQKNLERIIGCFGEDNVAYELSRINGHESYDVALPNFDIIIYGDCFVVEIEEFTNGSRSVVLSFYIDTFKDPEKFVEKLKDLNDKIPNLKEKGDRLRCEELKAQKRLQLNKGTLNSLVHNALRGSGCKFKLEFQMSYGLLSVTLVKGQYTTFKIPYSGMVERIQKIIPYINVLNTMMLDLDQPVRIKGKLDFQGWTEEL